MEPEQTQAIKRGPKIRELYYCACCEPHRTFKTAKKKGDHQRNIKKRQSKTEVGDVEEMSDFPELGCGARPVTVKNLERL